MVQLSHPYLTTGKITAFTIWTSVNKGPSSQGYGFSSGHVWMWELDYKESWVPKKNWCFWIGVLEKTLESPLDCKETKPVNPKGNQPWRFVRRTDAAAPIFWSIRWREELTHWKRPWQWERLRVGGEGDDRGLDGWVASPTWWMWVWASSRRWWRTGKPVVLQSMGLERVKLDWATEQQQLIDLLENLLPVRAKRTENKTFPNLLAFCLLFLPSLFSSLLWYSLTISFMPADGQILRVLSTPKSSPQDIYPSHSPSPLHRTLRNLGQIAEFLTENNMQWINLWRSHSLKYFFQLKKKFVSSIKDSIDVQL